MQLTLAQVEALNPRPEDLAWYQAHGSPDLLTTLRDVIKAGYPNWASWLYTRLMTPDQCRQIAVFAAEQVLPLFEREYPDDKRPRLAIEAAKSGVATTADIAYAYATEAADAAYAADARYAAYAAYAASTAASASADVAAGDAYRAATAAASATAYAAYASAHSAYAASPAPAPAPAPARASAATATAIATEAVRILEAE